MIRKHNLLASPARVPLMGRGFTIGQRLGFAQIAGSATLTVPSGTVASSLTDFPLYVDLSDMPAGFWTTSNGGRDLRASVGGTQVPCDLVWLDEYNQRGTAFIKVTLASGADTVVDLTWDGSSARPAVGSAFGRNAVWSAYEAVYTFGVSNEDRTGKRRSILASGDMDNFAKSTLHTFTQDPHQGPAYDHATDSWYLIDTNAIYKFSEDFSTLQASNLDPCGDANTALGITQLDHLCDATVANGYLVVPANDFQAQGANNVVGYFLRFDLATLAFVDGFNISATRPKISGVCWDEQNNRYVSVWWATMTELDVWDTSFTRTGTIPLTNATQLSNPQGIECWQDQFYVSNDAGDEVYVVEPDGHTQLTGIVGDDAGTGNFEGLCIYKGGLAVLVDPTSANSSLRYYQPFTDPLYIGGGSEHDGGISNYKEIAVGSVGTTWTMACSYEMDVFAQMALMTYRDASSGATNDRATLATDDGDKAAVWDNVNSWLYASPNIDPGRGVARRIAAAYSGTTRQLFFDGALVNSQSGITPRDADFDMITIGTDDESRADVLNGKIGFAYLRGSALSADWMAAEFDNISSPATFYSIA